jgi:hypothetical protein
VTDQEVIPGCARVRTKCAEKTIVGPCAGQVRDMWPVVAHASSADSCGNTGVCGSGAGHVARRGTWVGTGRMDVFKRGSSWTGVDRRSSKGVSV